MAKINHPQNEITLKKEPTTINAAKETLNVVNDERL